MYDYILKTIVQKKHLHWGCEICDRKNLTTDNINKIYILGRSGGLEFHSYFLFKFAYE